MKVALIGGSREAERLEEALEAAGIVVDPMGEIAVIAPHPFDTDLWECAKLSVAGKPHVGLARPGWLPEDGDDWRMASSNLEAAGMLGQSGAKRALLAVGNGRLLPFYKLQNIELCVRSRNTPHPPAPPNGLIRPLRGPFDVATEIKELQAQGVDMIVAHNAGGRGGWPKLAAARALGLPVILIDRPKLPEMEMVNSVETALAWVKRHMGLDESTPRA